MQFAVSSWFKCVFKGWASGELFACGTSPGGWCLVVPPFLIPTWPYQRCCTMACVKGKMLLPNVEQQSASECSGSAAERLKAAQAMVAPAGSQLCLRYLGVKKSQAHWLSVMARVFMDTSAVEEEDRLLFPLTLYPRHVYSTIIWYASSYILEYFPVFQKTSRHTWAPTAFSGLE